MEIILTDHEKALAQAQANIGRTAIVRLPRTNATASARILGVRQAYGRVELEVQPMGGTGTFWIRHERAELKS